MAFQFKTHLVYASDLDLIQILSCGLHSFMWQVTSCFLFLAIYVYRLAVVIAYVYNNFYFVSILCVWVYAESLLQKRWFVPDGKPLLSRFPNRERQSGTKRGALLSRVWQPGQKVSFFHVFLFSIIFLFQLYFCISIKLMYCNSVCMISTNIYIYI